METNKLEWLRGPIPPVSESILTSGLLNQSASSSIKKNVNNLNNQKKIFQSAPVPILKTTVKIPFKPKHVLSLKSKKDKSIDSSLKPLNRPIVPSPQIAKNYKAPPIDEAALTFKKSSSTLIPKENLTEKVLLAKQSNYREFIQDLVCELDSNIASIVPISPEAISSEDQAKIKSKLMVFYNYSFNQLILKEKTISSEKAILLRRFMKFYNQVLYDYPLIIEDLKNKSQSYTDNVSDLQTKINDLTNVINDKNKSLQKAEEKIEETKNQLEKAINDSNSKDIAISTISYDFDLLKSQFNRLQFNYNKLKEENSNLSNSLKQRDEEIKDQFNQIEDITKKLADYQQGDTGYILMYHQEKSKVESLEKAIVELKQKIHDLENIEKTSIAVDTSDLPVKKTKKKKMTKVSSISNYQSASNSSTNLPQPNEDESTTSVANQKKKRSQTPKLKSNQIEMTDAITQIDAKETFSLSIEKDPVTFCVNLIENENEEKSDESAKTVKNDKRCIDKSDSNFFNATDYLNHLNTPDGYEIDEKMNKIPLLQKFIMPLFSEVYIQDDQKDLKSFIYNIDQISSQSEKPLIWGLQLIHSFLTDPFVRSIENKSCLSNEDIFVNWISNQYKIQHLVNQVILDFASIISRFRYDSMIRLFLDLLKGHYNFSQLCFLSTVYSFACTLTNPDIVQSYQNFELIDHDQIMIHIKAVHKLYSLCFSEEVGNNAVLFIFKQKNNSEEKIEIKSPFGKFKFNDSEVVDFISFLRNITEFFGEKHKLISSQASNLLSLVGCTDSSAILFDVFESVMTILGSSPNSIKSDWKLIVGELRKSENPYINMKEMLQLCVEKDQPLRNLLLIPELKKSISRMKSMSQLVYELYHEFIGRFSKKLPHVLSMLSSEIVEKVNDLVQKLKIAILEADLQKMIWVYKKLISKIDYLKMKEMGFIPFDYKADADVIMHLSQYINKAEDVSFALLSI